MNRTEVINHTINWLIKVVVGLNFCPFAKREVDKGSIRYSVEDGNMKKCLQTLIKECDILNSDTEVETTLLIFPEGFESFDTFLDLVDLSNDLLAEQGYEGTYQLANFHPDYCFAGVPENDSANYTNRSPYPMLHLIREKSLEKAIQSHPNPTKIPDTNIQLAREMGEEQLKQLLASCF